ncbi:MAG: DUF2254 domain-containing protein [Rhizobiaceae bacterium]|nr:DUF2254 domain-containing protein [Rhizobiaceae bacterium]MCV0407771.1 DUF2254 domain-containing protein [Rhizobiaceae bacterium]
MIPRWRWLLGLLTRRLWFRSTLISLLAIASALVSLLVAPYLPSGLSAKIGADAVDSILTIIASSMLAVTTFSLSTMVSAYSAATSNVTPRATKLLIEDSTAQNVLATFVGSFLFSLVSLITLSMGAYGERGRVVLFVVTIGVVLLIVITLLRWIDYLLRFGRVGETTAVVEDAAEAALRARHENQYLGGTPLRSADDIPAAAVPVNADRIGYVQYVDMSALNEVTERYETHIFLAAGPGTFMDPGRPLAFLAETVADEAKEDIRDAFTIAEERTYDQDPRFGLCVLAEIASRALSPGINDPGTAIDVLGRSVRILAIWAGEAEPAEPVYPAVHVPTIELGELFDDLFHPIARDGAGTVEVQIRLQKALEALARIGDGRFAAEARRHSGFALQRADKALALDEDRRRLKAAAAWAA